MGTQIITPVKAVGKAGRAIVRQSAAARALTRNETVVYEALCDSDIPLKAYDLLDSLQDHGLRSPMTIYRALEALIANGKAKKIESLNAFVAIRSDGAATARAYLICKDCMQAKEIKLDAGQVETLFSPMPVSASDVVIEAYGACHQVCGDKPALKK